MHKSVNRISTGKAQQWCAESPATVGAEINIRAASVECTGSIRE
jgi:hypothetical protein